MMDLHLDVFLIILSAAYLFQQTDAHANVCQRRKITNVKYVGHKGYENLMDILIEERAARVCAEEQLKTQCKGDQFIHGCFTMLLSEKNQRHFTVTASSTHSSCNGKNNYRLDNPSAWCAAVNNDKQYIQVTFTKMHMFRGVVTQNRGSSYPPQMVTQYKIFYSTDCVNFKTDGKTYSGNLVVPSTVIRMFGTPVKGNCIRINPTKWASHVSMRFDVIGCEV